MIAYGFISGLLLSLSPPFQASWTICSTLYPPVGTLRCGRAVAPSGNINIVNLYNYKK